MLGPVNFCGMHCCLWYLCKTFNSVIFIGLSQEIVRVKILKVREKSGNFILCWGKLSFSKKVRENWFITCTNDDWKKQDHCDLSNVCFLKWRLEATSVSDFLY